MKSSEGAQGAGPFLLLLAGPLLLGVLLSCASEGRAPERMVRGDTVFVQNPAPRIADTLEPVEVGRIGRAEGPAPHLFGWVYGFHVTPSGVLLVHDVQDRGVRKFGPGGEYLGYLAREGEGPGETRAVPDFAASVSGEVAAYDLGNERITVLKADGSVWSLRRPEGPRRYHPDALSYHQDGSLWVALNSMRADGSGVRHPRPVFARIDASGALVDTVWTEPRFAEECPTLSSWTHYRGFWEDQREPFVPKVEWTLGRNGTLVMGCPASYRFEILGESAQRVVVERAWEPLETQSEVRAFRRETAGHEVPPTRPAYASLLAPGDGRIWIWPNQPMVEVELPPPAQERVGRRTAWQPAHQGAFDVFSEDGEWLAVVRLPQEARYSGFPTEPRVVTRGDTLWAVAEDSLEIQTIRKYVVPGLPEGM